MASNITKETIDLIKANTDLVAIIGRDVKLEPVSQDDHLGKCPFHAEDTGSFRVNQSRYHCFGCRAHGDIFSWLRLQKGLSFPAAIRHLSNEEVPYVESGALPTSQKPIRPPAFSVYNIRAEQRITEINTIAQRFFVKRLKIDKTATEYYSIRFSEGILETFFLGYMSPLQNDQLIKYLVENGVSWDELVTSGLFSEGEPAPQCRLRDRITIPLMDINGSILGFAGRIIPRLHNKEFPKYVNPTNTEAFQRSRYLFGLHIENFNPFGATIVEGFVDMMRAWDNAGSLYLASLGTQITASQRL